MNRTAITLEAISGAGAGPGPDYVNVRALRTCKITNTKTAIGVSAAKTTPAPATRRATMFGRLLGHVGTSDTSLIPSPRGWRYGPFRSGAVRSDLHGPPQEPRPPLLRPPALSLAVELRCAYDSLRDLEKSHQGLGQRI